MKKVKEYINNIVPIDDEEWKLFESKLKYKTIQKKDFLLHKDEVENYISFISSGVVRLFIPGEEKEVTFGFVFQGEFVSAFDSFVTKKKSTYSIQALTDVEFWQISYDDLESIYDSMVMGDRIGRKISENLFLIKSGRELDLLTKTASERYLDLFKNRPQLIKEIPLKYISSYVGVTPQGLSRIRAQIS